MMDCKVRIGVAYEPKWFEKRANNGTYSAKNPVLDSDSMWLQGVLIGVPKPHYSKRLPITVIAAALVFTLFYFTYA
jgi:hypothetical protein